MISPKEYDKIVKKNSPKSTIFKNCLMAFLIGGAICTVGQGLLELYQMWGLDEDTSKTLTSVTLIFFGILLTAIGVYDKIAKHAGAGTLVPITGFANAVSSPAIEFKAEGYVTGLGTKLFIIAGPVIVYGVSASIIYGAVLWILHMFGITLF
ncbi:MAG: stage V sporulation protein AC [Ruminococcus bromii]|nr:stage V sporulation protein AC [Ruminococcus bromii]MCI7211976.1 stage V sporulation protein AC [Ruminococcus bromii]MDD6433322.1 stage V sporulation protein AC [Ruminococcus bromii]MDY4085484.1 stage V sporulation protein AC [Ruminococcus bromii]MDY4711899.1 stage V sporulation protein AC [Ruminococcus bromii]